MKRFLVGIFLLIACISTTLAQSQLLFEDSFDTNSYAWEESSRDPLSQVTNGAYSISLARELGWNVAPGFTNWSKAPIFKAPYEYSVDVNIFTSNPRPVITLIFNVSEQYKSFVAVYISNGIIRLRTRGGSSDVPIEKPFESDVFLFDGRTHQIAVRVTEARYEILADDQLLATFASVGPINGTIGFGSYNEANAVTEINFDNVRVKALPSLTPTATRIPPTRAASVSTPYPTFIPSTNTPLPPIVSSADMPTTAITNGNASRLSLIGIIPLPIKMDITGISADRSAVVLAGSGKLYAYDLINLRLIELPNAGGYNDIGEPEIAISPDGRYIAYPGGANNVNVYGIAEQNVVATLSGHTDTVQAVVFSPTGLTLATAANESIRIWDVDTWRLTKTLERNDPLQLRVDRVFALVFSPNGQAILAATYANVDLWDVASGTLAGSMGTSQRQVVSNGSMQQIMIVPTAAALVGLSEYTTIDVWSLQTLKVTATFSVNTRAFDVNAGGNLLVTEDSGGFNVYSFFTTERIFTGKASYSFPTKPYFARNDTILVIVRSDDIQLWGIP